MPEPISTAPTDGTPILTDDGFVVFDNKTRAWVACDPYGNIFGCYHCCLRFCKPILWEPIPQWILE